MHGTKLVRAASSKTLSFPIFENGIRNTNVFDLAVIQLPKEVEGRGWIETVGLRSHQSTLPLDGLWLGRLSANGKTLRLDGSCVLTKTRSPPTVEGEHVLLKKPNPPKNQQLECAVRGPH